MPRLAIVIPCPGGAEFFEDTLVSVLQHRPAHTDVVVVHAQHYADPYRLEGEVTFLHSPGERNLCTLVNRGVAHTKASIIHLLGCGVIAADGWAAPALRHFQDATIGAVVPLVASTQDATRLASAGLEWIWGGSGGVLGRGTETRHAARLAPRVLGPDWKAALYRRSLLEALGGFDPQMTIDAAALDIALCLRELQFGVELETQCVVSGPVTDGAIPARVLEQLYWRHGANSEWSELLVGHPWQWVSQAARYGAGTLAGRLTGLLSAKGRSAHAQRLEHARELLHQEDPDILPFAQPPRRPSARTDRKAA